MVDIARLVLLGKMCGSTLKFEFYSFSYNPLFRYHIDQIGNIHKRVFVTVLTGLALIPPPCTIVLVHDPFSVLTTKRDVVLAIGLSERLVL